MDTQFSNFTQYPKTASSPKKRAFIYLGVFVLLIAGAILLGNSLLSSSNDQSKSVALTPTPTIEAMVPTEQPTPTEAAKITTKPSPTVSNKATPTPTVSPKTTTTPASSKSLQIEVLNGSGISGEAVRAASLLKAAGYSITGTGNADAFTYQETVIQIKKSKASFGSQLKKDLSSSYTVDPVIQTLAETSTSDAIVILGAK